MRQQPAFPPALLEMLAQQLRSGRLSMDDLVHQAPQAPVSLTPQQAGQRAVEELAQTRSVVGEILEQCNQQTEQEVLHVGHELHEIVTVAESFIHEVRDNFEALHPSPTTEDADTGGIVDAINQQSDAMHAFMEAVLDNATTQAEASTAALEQVETIMRVGATINEVARSSKMLALNASIEAARLGAQGRSFVVIASQMQSLSERVHESNQLVAEMAGKLLRLLPKIVDTSTDLQQRTDAFHSDFSNSVANVRAGTQKLEGALDSVLGSGDAHLATILQRSQSALSHLQFQDPVAQRLGQVDTELARLEQCQQALLGSGIDIADLRQELTHGTDELTALKSGEVLLF